MNKTKNEETQRTNHSFPMYIIADTRMVEVLGEFQKFKDFDIPKEDLVDRKGYIERSEERIWIYLDRETEDAKGIGSIFSNPNVLNEFPYFWFESDGSIHTSKPDAYVSRLFKTNRLAVPHINHIIEDVKNKPNREFSYDQQILDEIDGAAEVLKTTVYLADDFLTKIIKMVINKSSIVLQQFKGKISKQYDVSNMRSSLVTPTTKMSTKYFMKWVELLDLDVAIIVKSKGKNPASKLEEPYVYLFERDSIFPMSEVKGLTDFPHVDDTPE